MPIRETFWNIPHWAEIAQYLLGFLTILIFGYGVIRRIRRWLKGQPERRIDQIGKRLWSVVVHGIRLNMLEFSGHLGMQWSGKTYQPFKEVNSENLQERLTK